jgi:hypothetical protein
MGLEICEFPNFLPFLKKQGEVSSYFVRNLEK